jgi:type II secretory pathway component PulM
MAFSGGLGSFDRLSSREKVMVLGLVGGITVLIVAVALLWSSSVLGELEEEIAFNEELFVEINDAVIPYREAMAKVSGEKDRIVENDVVSLRLPVNKIARSVALPDGSKLSDQLGSLAKQIETPIDTTGKKKRNGKKRKREKGEEGDVVRLEQDVQFRNIPLNALYEFLEGIDEKDLLFVTRLEIKRKFGGDFVNAQNAMVTVMTLRGQGDI